MANATSSPMYQKIKADILSQIESNILMPGDRLPTEYQLMEQYHVSRITISKALNELKSEGVIERFPQKGSFVAQPSSALINEVNDRADVKASDDSITEIACILPTITDLFSISMINGILSVFPENKYLCHIFQSHNPQRENYLLKRCLELKLSGIALFPQDQPFFSEDLLRMQLQKYPLVLLDRHLPRLDTSYVIADNKAAGMLCIRHLQELGHQRIAFVTATGRDTFSVKYRIEGIFAAAAELNMPESSIHIIENLKFRSKTERYVDMLRKVIKEDRVTAFIAGESGICSYLFNAFNALSLKMPGDVSLLSFDKPIIDNKASDFFTQINQSEYLMGKEAGKILRRRIEEHDMNVYHKVIVPTLEVHQSTGVTVL